MITQAALIAQLDELEATLPTLRAEYPDDGDFWMAFAGQADVIADNAGEFSGVVSKRIDDMLAKHGLRQ